MSRIDALRTDLDELERQRRDVATRVREAERALEEAEAEAERLAPPRCCSKCNRPMPTAEEAVVLKRDADRERARERAEHAQARALFVAAGKPVPSWVLA